MRRGVMEPMKPVFAFDFALFRLTHVKCKRMRKYNRKEMKHFSFLALALAFAFAFALI